MADNSQKNSNFWDTNNTGKSEGPVIDLLGGKTGKDMYHSRFDRPDVEFSGSTYNPNAPQFGNYDYYNNAVQTGIQSASNYDVVRQGQIANLSSKNIGAANLSGQTTIDQSQQNKFRNNQQQVIQALNDMLSGKTTSLAQQQLKAGQDANMRAALALREGSTNPGLAMRQAQDALTNSNLQTNQQAAQLRAQEVAQAQGLLSNVAGQGRSEDIGLAGQQAGLTQQINMANAGSLNQRQAEEAQNLQNYLLANQKNTQVNQSLKNDMINKYINAGMSMEEAQLKADADYNSMMAQQQNQQNQLNEDVSKQNADIEGKNKNSIVGLLGGLFSSLSDEQAKKEIKSGRDSADAFLDAVNRMNKKRTKRDLVDELNEKAMANMNYDESSNFVGYKPAMTRAQVGEADERALANMNYGESQDFMNSRKQARFSAPQSSVERLKNELARQNSQRQKRFNDAIVYSPVIGKRDDSLLPLPEGVQIDSSRGLAYGLDPNKLKEQDINYLSDERTKEPATKDKKWEKTIKGMKSHSEIDNPWALANWMKDRGYHPSDEKSKKEMSKSDDEVTRFLDNLEPFNFKYKNPSMDGASSGKKLGVMAQDIEKSEIGSQMVKNGSDGYKRIDVVESVGPILASLAYLNQKLKKLEKQK